MDIDQVVSGQAAHYRILEELGRGGFAVTYKSTVETIHTPGNWLVDNELQPGSQVLIKVPRTDRAYSDADNAAFIERVNRQLSMAFRALNRLAALSCVAKIFDHAQVGLRLPHRHTDTVLGTSLVEEVIQGKTLAEKPEAQGKLLCGNAIEIPIRKVNDFYNLATQLARNLMFIHRHQIIHGDIWYTNVMIRHLDNEVVYIDFGSSVFRDEFFRGPLLPTPQRHPFVPPEVRTGAAHGRRSDIYALGGLLYCLARCCCLGCCAGPTGGVVEGSATASGLVLTAGRAIFRAFSGLQRNRTD